MKLYVIFAGVNGAGKTTLYQTNDEYRSLPRVNLDEIVREIGSWRDMNDVSAAGKIAVKRIKEFFDSGVSFNQETTLCGHSIIRNIERAREYGYFVDLKYVGLESAELAVKRVEQRVRNGGHGIPTTDVKRRYRESLHNLKKVIQLCDRVRLYDNSKSFRKIASFSKGICTDCSDEIPKWCEEILFPTLKSMDK